MHLPLRGVADINCLWSQSVLCLSFTAGLIHSSPCGRPGLFWTSRDVALAVSSVNVDFDQTLDACVALINPSHRQTPPPLPRQSPSAAHQRPGIPVRPAEWQQHKSHGCIKNTLGQRKELGLHLSDTESLFCDVAPLGDLMHHHRLSDNVVTYGLTKCTTKHF